MLMEKKTNPANVVLRDFVINTRSQLLNKTIRGSRHPRKNKRDRGGSGKK